MSEFQATLQCGETASLAVETYDGVVWLSEGRSVIVVLCREDARAFSRLLIMAADHDVEGGELCPTTSG